jgi:membrane protein
MVVRNVSGMSTGSAEALWVTALTTILVFAGFKPKRFSSAAYARHSRSARARVPQNAYDAERGRLAEKPSDIPAPGWKDVIWRVYQNIGSDRVIALAAGVTVTQFLHCFPRSRRYWPCMGCLQIPTPSRRISTVFQGFFLRAD